MKVKSLPINAKENRAVLYHWTGYLPHIIKSNSLKPSSPSYSAKGKPSTCICVSRLNYFSASDCGGDIRLVLNQNLMIIDGYKSIPHDEIGAVCLESKKNVDVCKGNPQKGRWVHHNTNKENISKGESIEYEYEERFYREIKNVGKYIIAIQFKTKSSYDYVENELIDFLQLYSHIKIELIDYNRLWAKSVNISNSELLLI